MSVFKSNRIRRISENLNAQLRAEYFNVLNRANVASPTDHAAVFDQSGNPSQVSGSSRPRKQLLAPSTPRCSPRS